MSIKYDALHNNASPLELNFLIVVCSLKWLTVINYIYLRRESENSILQRVQLARAEYTHVSRLSAGEAELLVATEIRVQMAQNSSRLNFDGRYFSDSLNVKTVVEELVPDLVVVGDDNNLNNDLGMEGNIKTFHSQRSQIRRASKQIKSIDLVKKLIVALYFTTKENFSLRLVSSALPNDDSADPVHQRQGSPPAVIFPKCTRTEPRETASVNI